MMRFLLLLLLLFSHASYGVVVYVTTDYGMACDGVSDDTTPFHWLLVTVERAGGGTVWVNGTCVINGAVVLPNDGAVKPTQRAIRITGSGASANGYWAALPDSPSALDLRYADGPKIDTRGAGLLEIDHVTLKDSGNDCAPFVQTTNTTLRVHDVAFIGTATNGQACNDAIVAGGTSTIVDGSENAAFQGYGTTIRDNFFYGIRRGVYGRVYFNGVFIQNNTWSSTCGNPTGGAIEIDATGAGANTGNLISGNLAEIGSYKYFFKGTSVISNSLVDNQLFDFDTGIEAQYAFFSNSQSNTIRPGVGDDAYPLVYNDATSANNGNTNVANMLTVLNPASTANATLVIGERPTGGAYGYIRHYGADYPQTAVVDKPGSTIISAQGDGTTPTAGTLSLTSSRNPIEFYTTVDGSNYVQRAQINANGLMIPSLKSDSGVMFLCINTVGQIVSQASACSEM